MAHHPDLSAAPVYDAARRFREAALRSDGSMFTPGAEVWAPSIIDDLYRRFVEQPDESSDSFVAKFARQLSGASDATIQLATEMLYVHLLFPADIGGASKRELLHTVSGWAQHPVVIPAELDAALDQGLANTGVAYRTYRPHQLWFLLDFIRAWKRLGDQERRELLDDPWRFKAMLFEVPLKAAFAQREALLHLVHPDAFEHIVSREHKRKIIAAFKDRVPAGVPDVDRALLAIRESLARERSGPFHFYSPGIVEVWQPPDLRDTHDRRTGRRAWIVRPNVARENRLAEWLHEGFCAIGWSEMGTIMSGAERSVIMAAAERAYPDQSSSEIRAAAGNVDRFVGQMKVGDVVVVPDGADVYVGAVETEAYWVDDIQARRRGVEWLNPNRPIQRSDLSDAAASSLRTQLTVTDATEHLPEMLSLIELPPEDTVEPPPPQAELPDATDALAANLQLPSEWLDEVIDLLREKRQMIFYGPPGTGKTYVAQALADHLTAAGGNSQLVQFHPSYAYEDFFEGFRPRQALGDSGQIAFELVDGPLRRIAREAADDRSHPYVLVIDEINRGNLAKIFGELYFLLEYRDRAIQLQYSPNDEFRLPPNLYLIGTMNAADRSIALVDAAMRRRFYFVEFFPTRPPIDGLLRSWLRARQRSEVPADLLDELNRRIGDEDFAVGPSYLMSERSQDHGWLERVWARAILPLLEEHFFGTRQPIEDRFGLAGLERALAMRSEDSIPERPNSGLAEDASEESIP